jgi:hypothetical protein
MSFSDAKPYVPSSGSGFNNIDFSTMPPPPVPAFNLSANYATPASTLITNNEIAPGFTST